ncbi:MAG TPA: arginase [Azonexus sp.]|nr:arginase [Azonexus sp.]
MTKRIRIIGAASGLGAQDRACADGPVAYHRSQAWHELEHHPQVDWGRTLFAPEGPGMSAAGRIAGLCRQLADEVALALRAGEFPLVIGGDHSVAIGTWSGVARVAGAPVGLLWIDAHLDSHTPETTYSGAIHGMPLACLLGRGDKRLLNIGLPGLQVSAAHTVVLGPRSYEPEEIDFLQQMGVRIIDSEEILGRGFAACLDEAAAIVGGAPNGFGVTLDLDAIDPGLAPGVGSPEPEGLWDGDVLAAVRRLSALPGLRALEIVEYNPDRDSQGVTADLISDLIAEILPAVAG